MARTEGTLDIQVYGSQHPTIYTFSGTYAKLAKTAAKRTLHNPNKINEREDAMTTRPPPSRRAAVLVALALVACTACTACSNHDTPTIPDSQTHPSDSPTDTTGTTGNGISADEAKARGVFAADYDARFEDQRSTSNSSKSVLVLTNIGNKEDTYTITVTPPEAGSVSPDTTTVASGQSIQLTVHHNKQAEIKVHSHGRGTEIATRTLR